MELKNLMANSRTWFLRNLVLPAGDLAFGQRMMARLRFLEKAQWWDTDRVQTNRDELLTSLIKTAYNEVPFYRQLIEASGLRPDDIRHQQDLLRLPVVTKDMLRKGYPHLTTRDTGSKTYEVYTAGSTGHNFCLKEDVKTDGWFRASFLLSLEWTGWRIGDAHLQTGMTLERNLRRKLKNIFLNCHYISAFDLTDRRLDLNLDLLEKHKINYLWGYPGSLYVLARRALEKGWNRPLTSIVTWGDTLYPHYRKTIEHAFKARVFDNYGCGEGIQVSAQCGEMNNYHIHSLDVIVEYLDDNGCPVERGKTGNLILTRLHPGPMPLIRYKVGDIGTAGSDSRCKCGRGFELMSFIQGRDTDIIVTPSGNRLIVHFFTGILEFFPQVSSFQVVQNKRGSLVLRLVPAEGFSGDISDKIVETLKEKGAQGLNIDVEVVGNIPLPPSGKRRFVINNLAF